MALTTVSKIGASGALIIGAILGPTFISSNPVKHPVKHPVNVQKLLDWEEANGGCKVFMAIERDKGKLYRPGGEKKEAITDVHIANLVATLSSSDNPYKSKCTEKKGKALMFANKNSSWNVDDQDWTNKGGDVSLYLELFRS